MTTLWLQQPAVIAAYKLDANSPAPFAELFSKTSLEGILFYVFAVAAWTLEGLFALHRSDTEEALAQQHAHTTQWYVNKAKAFLYGQPLPPFADTYDPLALTAEQLAAARIVTYAAALRATRPNGRVYIRLKVAADNGAGGLRPLEDVELDAFAAYMAQIQDAGVDLECTSTAPDHIRQHWTIYYNPQVLDAQGNRLDGTAGDVVRAAIKGYLNKLPFNGVYVPTFHIDAVQAVGGVVIPWIDRVETRPDTIGVTFSPVPPKGVVADSGWFVFAAESDLTLEMLPYDAE